MFRFLVRIVCEPGCTFRPPYWRTFNNGSSVHLLHTWDLIGTLRSTQAFKRDTIYGPQTAGMSARARVCAVYHHMYIMWSARARATKYVPRRTCPHPRADRRKGPITWLRDGCSRAREPLEMRSSIPPETWYIAKRCAFPHFPLELAAF